MALKETGSDAVNWIHLAQDRDQLRALVRTVVNPLFHKMVGTEQVGVAVTLC
jgi:hypothetical protein